MPYLDILFGPVNPSIASTDEEDQGHTSNVRAVERPQELIETYRRSATLAKLAGFDGIELLCQGCVFLTHTNPLTTST